MTTTHTHTIVRGGNEYAVTAQIDLRWLSPEGEGSGILGDTAGWYIHDYKILSSELSGDVVFTDKELQDIFEDIF